MSNDPKPYDLLVVRRRRYHVDYAAPAEQPTSKVERLANTMTDGISAIANFFRTWLAALTPTTRGTE